VSNIVSPYRVLRPGKAPPPVLVYCARCDMPAERQCMDIVTTGSDWIGVHAQCCGATSSSRIAWKDFLRIKFTDEKWYAIPPRGAAPGVRSMLRSGFKGLHG
jgi:hypothetical protein